jgi:hypothetical protein
MTTPVKPFLSDARYNRLKWMAQIGLPSLGTLYFALDAVWGLWYASQIVGTVVAVDTFLGAVLNVSATRYNNSDARFDGSLIVAEDNNALIHKLDLTTDPEELGKQDEVVLKVEQGPPVNNL